MFGAKFVELIYPSDPSSQRLSAGQVLKSRNVTVEANTVFQNVVKVLDQIDPAKLNSTLSALAEGVRGQGERIGQATTDANQVLLELNPRNETIRADFRALKRFNDALSPAAQDILATLNAASTTSVTVTKNAKQLDALLLSTIGLSNAGIELLAPNQANLIKAINVLEPTTNLLYKYNPEYTCLLVGAKTLLDTGGYEAPGGNGRTLVLDTALSLGDDPYHYPDNLPVVGAKGGPGGKPSCGSLPDVAQNWPVRNLVTNTGFGTGMDWRPNPGIGFPGLGRLPAGHPRGARTAEHPQSVRWSGTGTDPVSGRPGLRCGPVRAGRYAALAWTAARTPAWRTTGSRPDAGLRAVRRPRACPDAADAATADPVAAGGGAVTVTVDQGISPWPAR